jgi:hypothetical protein
MENNTVRFEIIQKIKKKEKKREENTRVWSTLEPRKTTEVKEPKGQSVC